MNIEYPEISAVKPWSVDFYGLCVGTVTRSYGTPSKETAAPVAEQCYVVFDLVSNRIIYFASSPEDAWGFLKKLKQIFDAAIFGGEDDVSFITSIVVELSDIRNERLHKGSSTSFLNFASESALIKLYVNHSPVAIQDVRIYSLSVNGKHFTSALDLEGVVDAMSNIENGKPLIPPGPSGRLHSMKPTKI